MRISDWSSDVCSSDLQNHAAKLAQVLNEMADAIWPGKYQSDFAMQVTSEVMNAQTMTVQFANNNLGGRGNFDESYVTGKTRVCVTRSEARRVGKECVRTGRSRWSAYHKKKKKSIV